MFGEFLIYGWPNRWANLLYESTNIKQMLHMEVGWSERDNIYDSGNNIILEK